MNNDSFIRGKGDGSAAALKHKSGRDHIISPNTYADSYEMDISRLNKGTRLSNRP